MTVQIHRIMHATYTSIMKLLTFYVGDSFLPMDLLADLISHQMYPCKFDTVFVVQICFLCSNLLLLLRRTS